nr:protein ENHANCED DISEASE RESISTANCE 4 [Ipomoea batatas]
MSEPPKVRLVRCPKCENLLPEVTDFSVYQCGGCGTVLRAKNENGELETFSDKSDEERAVGVSEKFEKVMNLSDGSENDVKSNASSSCSIDERRGILRDRDENYRSNLTIKSDKWVLEDDDDAELCEIIDEHSQEKIVEQLQKFIPECESESENGLPNLEEIPNWRSGETSEAAEAFHRCRRVDDMEMYETGDEQSQERTMKQFQNSTIQYANEMGLQRPVRIPDWRSGEARKAEVSQRGRRIGIGIDGSMYAVSNNSADASSSYQVGSSYGYQQPLRSGNSEESSSSGFAKTEYSEDERAELLRKLDELKEQLTRPCEVIDNPKDKFPLDRKITNQDPYGDSHDWYPDGTSRIVNRGSMHYPVSNQAATRPPLPNHYQDPSLVLGSHGFYPPGHTSSHPQLFGDPLRSQRLRTDPYQTTPGQFQQHPSHPHIAGHYPNNEIIDHLQPYAPNVNRHHPSCTCFHCYRTNQNLVQALPTAFGDGRFSNVPGNPIFYHHENPGRFGPQDYDPRIPSALPMKTQNPQSQRRWPGDLNSDVGVLVRRRPPGLQPPSSGQRCRPIAGGAPFLTCHNCLELLHLPKRAFLRDRKQRKMKCGACSSIMVFAVANKRLISVREQVKKNGEMFTTDDNLPQESSYFHGHINQPSTIFSSEDFDNSRYDFHAMDEEHRSLSTGQASSVKSMEVRSHRSKSSSMSAEEGNLVASAATAINSNPVELPMKDKVSPPPAGSPLQDHFDYSTKYNNNTANRFENGNLSGRSSPDKMMLKKNSSRQTSMKDVSVATEMDISSNEYANTGSSLESGESSKGDRLNSNKTTESFFAGIAKRSFKSKHVAGEERSNVSVNGHLIPDQLIKKAEKVAGKINPGHYWYDFRAGFWGVMGGPCLGIVPPFIEEFNYPMPENCAGGNTGVFVNGRELHNKDLQLLCSRGLSSERDRSYIVEISGRVLDEDTGEELDSLGKLAPTVERMKRGFGMKVPKRAA